MRRPAEGRAEGADATFRESARTRTEALAINAIGCAAAAGFLAFFGAVYEHFSHEVYSYYMIYAFAIPLFLGALPYGISALEAYREERRRAGSRNAVGGLGTTGSRNAACGLYAAGQPDAAAMRLWNFALAAFSIGSVMKGVLDIYGTENSLILIYPIAGGILAAASLAAFLLSRKKARKPIFLEQGQNMW